MADTALRLVLFFGSPKTHTDTHTHMQTETEHRTVLSAFWFHFHLPFLVLFPYFLFGCVPLCFRNIYSFIFIRSASLFFFTTLYQCVHTVSFAAVVIVIVVCSVCYLCIRFIIFDFHQNAFDFRSTTWMSYEYALFIRLFAFRIWITAWAKSEWERRQHHVA